MMRVKLPVERIKALYWDLYNIKEAVGMTEWVSQLNQYITFVMLLKKTGNYNALYQGNK